MIDEWTTHILTLASEQENRCPFNPLYSAPLRAQASAPRRQGLAKRLLRTRMTPPLQLPLVPTRLLRTPVQLRKPTTTPLMTMMLQKPLQP